MRGTAGHAVSEDGAQRVRVQGRAGGACVGQCAMVPSACSRGGWQGGRVAGQTYRSASTGASPARVCHPPTHAKHAHRARTQRNHQCSTHLDARSPQSRPLRAPWSLACSHAPAQRTRYSVPDVGCLMPPTPTPKTGCCLGQGAQTALMTACCGRIRAPLRPCHALCLESLGASSACITRGAGGHQGAAGETGTPTGRRKLAGLLRKGKLAPRRTTLVWRRTTLVGRRGRRARTSARLLGLP
jgi:hypothetical protein